MKKRVISSAAVEFPARRFRPGESARAARGLDELHPDDYVRVDTPDRSAIYGRGDVRASWQDHCACVGHCSQANAPFDKEVSDETRLRGLVNDWLEVAFEGEARQSPTLVEI